jgi:Ca2+:H+ antiporter
MLRLLPPLALPVAALAAVRLLDAPEPVAFVAAIAGLVPVAWLIGRATEEAGMHGGPVVGGFLNATFGNAPELFLAFFALEEGLFVAVRGSLTGSVPSNLLLMLGLTLLVARGGEPTARRSVVLALVLAGAATVAMLVAEVGHVVEDSESALAAWEIPLCVALLVLYVVVTTVDMRARRHEPTVEEDESADWSLRRTLVLLALATAVAGLLVEGLTASLVSFSEAVGLSLFVLSVTALALVSDTAEHSAAVFVSARGRLALGMEVVLRTVAQIVAFLLPVIVLLSWARSTPLPLDPRGVELAVMAGSVALAALVLGRGRPTRPRGGVLVGGYVAGVAAFVAFG